MPGNEQLQISSPPTQSGLFSIGSFLNRVFSQSGLFSIWSFLNRVFSQSDLFSIGSFLNLSSRDNSIIIIKVLIGIIVYDLDVELNILICAVAFLILVCSTNEYLHDLSLNRRKSDWFLSNK